MYSHGPHTLVLMPINNLFAIVMKVLYLLQDKLLMVVARLVEQDVMPAQQLIKLNALHATVGISLMQEHAQNVMIML